jgi:hypothetical protein
MSRLRSHFWLMAAFCLAVPMAGAQPPVNPRETTAVEVAPQAQIIPDAAGSSAPASPAPSLPPAAIPPATGATGSEGTPAAEDARQEAASPPVLESIDPALQPQAAFNRAVIAYKAGAINDARREFLAIAGAGHLSAALAHNLGNIEFRLGNPGQAALWYRRALVLQPFSPETLQNLRTLRRQQAFLSFDPFLLSFSHLSPRWISQGTILTAWVAGLLLIWLLVLPPRPGRRWPLVALLMLVLPVLALGSILTWQTRTDPHPLSQRLVVSGKETQAYAAPAEASSTIIALPAGSEVLPLETRGNWIYCIIPGGEGKLPLRGWIRAPRTEPLWPWPGGLPTAPATSGVPTPDPSAA